MTGNFIVFSKIVFNDMTSALKEVSVEFGKGEDQNLVRLKVDIPSRVVETERIRKNTQRGVVSHFNI